MSNVVFRTPRASLIAILGCAFLSGVTCLILELVWSRYLQLIFGVSVYAIATVLACFMLGLAIGNWHGGRLADRIGSPARLFAVLQIGIGLFCLLSGPLYKAGLLLATHGPSADALPSIRVFSCFVISFLFLLLPTYCIGAAFPILTKLSVGSDLRVGRRVGVVYMAN